MVTRVGPDPPHLPRIVTRSEALAAGLTRDQVRQRVRGGHWLALDVGVYLRAGSPVDGLDPFALARVAHVQRCVAAVLRRPGSVIGMGSAALFHAMPLASGIPPLATLLVPAGSWTGRRNGVNSRLAHLTAADIDRRGIPATTVNRTWIDIARTMPLADALSAGDGALRLGMLDVGETEQGLTRLGQVRGRRRAARAASHLDARRETPLESWSYALFVEWQLPLPLLQQDFRDDRGFVARTDFWWPHCRVVGEADGRLKYQDPGDLYAEKRREDRLRALGLTVVRWSWGDLARDPERLRRRLEYLLARSS